MFATIKSLIPEPRQADQPRKYVGKHRQPDPVPVPEPGPVLRQPLGLTNDARRAVPTTLVCCSMPSEQVLELARSGNAMFAEVANLEHLDVVDLPTGHWPMWSRAGDLAQAIQSEASRTD